MLEEVRIGGLGVIDEAVLALSPGFTVVTGETGAGKTMVVTGLGLLFGGRADPARVRPGADRASVEGRLRVDPASSAARQVAEAGGDLDDDGQTLIISRSVSAEGRSRAFAGGRSVPVSLLTYLADDLIAVHGQADQQQLLRPGRQRAALDRFGGPPLRDLLAGYQRAFRAHQAAAAELAGLRAAAAARAAEADELARGLAEIDAAEPAPGEDAELAAEDDRLANADALASAATLAHEALLGDPASSAMQAADAVSLLGAARRALQGAAGHDPDLAALGERVSEALYLVSDVAGELASYAEGIDADPARLAAVQERRAQLARLVRSYGAGPAGNARRDPGGQDPGGQDPGGQDPGGQDPGGQDPGEQDPDGVPDLAGVLRWAQAARARLALLYGDEEKIGALAAAEAALAAEVTERATALTGARQEAASQFAAQVSAELAALAMPHARLTAAVLALAAPGPHGADEVELRLAAHPGAPPLPLHKGASGGELSRVMLAIEVVFAGADPVPTFVFDEVDAGVGGRAAVEIGRRLARLARRAQVIVVTHLAQVAAYADAHLVVEKAGDGLVTRSGLTRLDQPGRIRELSRMLAGLEDSEHGQAHASELLAAAAADRNTPA